METLFFFIISLFALLTFFYFMSIIIRSSRKKNDLDLPMRQSTMFLLVKTMLPADFNMAFEKETQAFNYEDNKSLKYVQMPDNKVYWLDKNRIYYTNLGSDGRFDPSEGKLTDMKNIPEKEVAKMLYIYNTLKSEQQ